MNRAEPTSPSMSSPPDAGTVTDTEDSGRSDREIAASKPMSPERLRLVFYSFRKELLVLSGLAGLFALAKLLDKLFS